MHGQDLPSVERVHYGFIMAPEGSPEEGEAVPVCGYVIRHPDGPIIVDTGIAPPDPPTRRRYRPRGIGVVDALEQAGIRPRDARAVINCHLHADHAGGNSSFPGIPIVVQRAELEAARHAGYTERGHAVDFPSARFHVVDGLARVLPGVIVMPTPGHSPGHQAVVVDTPDGKLVLAGQAFDTASAFGFAAFAGRLARAGYPPAGSQPPWMRSVMAVTPTRVLFAHDLAALEHDGGALTGFVPL